ncbi:hypothetical protein DIPPA_23722 [Diplonema papillatum]|nr:hypothetical protein DIPPA_23722 [Diplonema papillatum]
MSYYIGPRDGDTLMPPAKRPENEPIHEGLKSLLIGHACCCVRVVNKISTRKTRSPRLLVISRQHIIMCDLRTGTISRVMQSPDVQRVVYAEEGGVLRFMLVNANPADLSLVWEPLVVRHEYNLGCPQSPWHPVGVINDVRGCYTDDLLPIERARSFAEQWARGQFSKKRYLRPRKQAALGIRPRGYKYNPGAPIHIKPVFYPPPSVRAADLPVACTFTRASPDATWGMDFEGLTLVRVSNDDPQLKKVEGLAVHSCNGVPVECVVELIKALHGRTTAEVVMGLADSILVKRSSPTEPIGISFEDAADGVGLVLKSVTEGTAAYRAGATDFVGHRIAAVNDQPVETQPQLLQLAAANRLRIVFAPAAGAVGQQQQQQQQQPPSAPNALEQGFRGDAAGPVPYVRPPPSFPPSSAGSNVDTPLQMKPSLGVSERAGNDARAASNGWPIRDHPPPPPSEGPYVLEPANGKDARNGLPVSRLSSARLDSRHPSGKALSTGSESVVVEAPVAGASQPPASAHPADGNPLPHTHTRQKPAAGTTVLRKKHATEALGIDLQNFCLVGVEPGSAAAASGFDRHVGQKLTHADGVPVRTIEELNSVIKGLTSIPMTFAARGQVVEARAVSREASVERGFVDEDRRFRRETSVVADSVSDRRSAFDGGRQPRAAAGGVMSSGGVSAPSEDRFSDQCSLPVTEDVIDEGFGGTVNSTRASKPGYIEVSRTQSRASKTSRKSNTIPRASNSSRATPGVDSSYNAVMSAVVQLVDRQTRTEGLLCDLLGTLREQTSANRTVSYDQATPLPASNTHPAEVSPLLVNGQRGLSPLPSPLLQAEDGEGGNFLYDPPVFSPMASAHLHEPGAARGRGHAVNGLRTVSDRQFDRPHPHFATSSPGSFPRHGRGTGLAGIRSSPEYLSPAPPPGAGDYFAGANRSPSAMRTASPFSRVEIDVASGRVLLT